MSNREKRTNAPPFYNLHDDAFYHGPAWVIKPKIFQPKENLIKTPGPADYHIPDRSIYSRPGKTIGSRYETTSSISSSLLAHYNPNDQFTSNAKMPAISIIPRRTEHKQEYVYSGRLYFPSESKYHRRAPLLRPLYGPVVSWKTKQLISPGPAAYPIYEFDHNDHVLLRTKPGFTQKHRFLSDQKLRTNPPFYYPAKIDRHRLPSFTIGKRLFTSEKYNSCAPPYYSSFGDNHSCSNLTQPGVTLKGRWNPSVYNGAN
ncbi:unnamed protein product [Rotaria magnacalcarata]|uniref:Uncharacterized protein n=1 Tax=Rotaria magnacalcarata TaxID=392030 RepID=A0A816Y192_9BILA|nr:unnamed protein product [Rotaria magnacalcarata]CAF2154145.1 unnamed protein product [Rotaria magnacalcarata]CAF3834743.1 unnamed protein product [Rotaria magnacalcarata]CAF4225008.1 unnamed protein product [Rotaria magnacalcarata]